MTRRKSALENLKDFWPEGASQVNQVKKYVAKYQNDNLVIKCGGKILVDPQLLKNFTNDVWILKKLGMNVTIIHGGGPRIKKKLEELNIKSNFVRGLRVTDSKTMSVVEEVLKDFNSEIVRDLNKKSCNAKGVNVGENNVFLVDPENKELGFVGKPKKILNDKIYELLKSKFLPVLSPMGLDEKNKKYNINADTAASALAKSIKARRLLLMTDVEGVYDENKKLISEINSKNAKKLIENKVVSGGMIPKLENCIDAVANGVRGVVIIDGRKPHSVLNEIFSDKGAGTLIRK
tara:strand:+ start:8 stop:880 length:873 start_codon:yes stop_codon:yes gene_type:complete